MRMLLPLLLAASPAFADECPERDAMVAALASKYGETAAGAGLSDNGVVLEVYRSTKTGTWTVIASGPDGKSCLVAAGALWEAVPEGDPL